jgi:hypothetical protein
VARGRVCRLQLLLAFASAVILGSKSRGIHPHILLSQIVKSRSLNLYSPRTNKVAQLYLRALGSLFVAYYQRQGYSGGIRILLQAGGLKTAYRIQFVPHSKHVTSLVH